MLFRLTGLISFCLFAAIASAEVYKSIDEDGKVIYTDNPRGNQSLEKVDLPSVNSQPAIHVPPIDNTPKPEAIRPTIEIESPTSGTQVPTGQTEVLVSARIQPFLNANHRIRFIHNGKTIAKAARSSSLLLDNLHRGEHQISAQLTNKAGKVIARSKIVVFYVQRPKVKRGG